MDKWSRKKIKEIAKARMNANYWKCVLVSMIAVFLIGSGAMSAVGSGGDKEDEPEQINNTEMVQIDGGEDGIYDGDNISEGSETDYYEVLEKYPGYKPTATGILLALFTALVVTIVAIVLQVFVLNPMYVGCCRFFYQNLHKNAEVKEICYTFDRGYKNAVKAKFFADLYTFLWSLLFIIPGIVKSYEYMLIPFLLSENENMTKAEAFAESKRLMKGNKWRAFVLDLSLLPWILAMIVSFGILGVFYVYPYFHSVGAAFYEAVKEEDLYQIAAKDA